MAKVKIYKTHTCPFCKMESGYLKENGIEFDEVFVDDDFEQAKEMMEVTGQMGVPFTVIETDSGEKINILGFDKKKISQALGI
jgi:alkyl hydroperoxide reductase subunit F